jgi:hypothetical protein
MNNQNEIEEIEENRDEIENNRDEIEPVKKITEPIKIDVLREKKNPKKTSVRQMKGLEKARRTKELKKMLKIQKMEQMEQMEPEMEQEMNFMKHLPMLGISCALLGAGFLLIKSMKSKMNTLERKIVKTELNYNPAEMVESLREFVEEKPAVLEEKLQDIPTNSNRPTRLQLNF